MATIIITESIESGHVPHNLHSPDSRTKVTVLNIPYADVNPKTNDWRRSAVEINETLRQVVGEHLGYSPDMIDFSSTPSGPYVDGPDNWVGVKILETNPEGFTPDEWTGILPKQIGGGLICAGESGKVEMFRARGNISAMVSGEELSKTGIIITQRWVELPYKVRLTR